MAKNKMVCTFFLSDLMFGIDAMEVQEVIRRQKMTPVPLAPPQVEGLMNLRGKVVTVINLRRHLGLAEAAEELESKNIVVETTDGLVSLLVDRVGDVFELDETMCEPTPDVLNDTMRPLVQGVYQLDGRLLLLLDVALTVEITKQA